MAAKKKSNPEDEVAVGVIEAIKSGAFDGMLEQFDDAVTDRSNVLVAEEQKAARKSKVKSAPTEKKVSAPPKKTARTAKVTPKENTVYLVSSAFKSLAGAKVEFQRFRNGDKNKSVVIMKTDKPGNPKGKRVVVPTSALENVPASASAKRAPAKNTTAKKTTKK